MFIQLVDGATLECTSFRVIDAGVLLFDALPTDEEDEREATCFIPYEELRYILPDELNESERPMPPQQRQHHHTGEPQYQPQSFQGGTSPGY